MLLPRNRIRLAFRSLRPCPFDDLFHGLQVRAVGIALGRRKVAPFAELVPGVEQHDPLGRGLVRVLVHPRDGRFQGRGELRGRAVGEVPAGLLAQPALSLPGPLVPADAQRGHVGLRRTAAPCPLVGLDQLGVLAGLGLGGVARDDVVVRACA